MPIDCPRICNQTTENDIPPGSCFLAAWDEMVIVKPGDWCIFQDSSSGLKEVHWCEQSSFEDSLTR
eukprot:5208729-Pyramimonas_sp.AAC.1